MPNDEFQKERPQIQKGPSPSDARSETRLPLADDNRFLQPDPVLNRMALLSFRLGAFGVILGLRLQGGYLSFLFPMSVSLILGPAALIFGVLGIRYRNRHPTAGGLGDAVSGIVMGLLAVLVWCATIFWVATHLSMRSAG
jgi:hypothetical protein